MDQNKDHNRVIYVMGAGRSGTTITDIILGNAEGAESLGEIFRFAELRGVPHGFEDGSEASIFWGKIREKFSNVSEYSFMKLDSIAHSVEYHSNYVKTYLGLNSKKNTIPYNQYINSLFDIIFEFVPDNVVIDSSMYPGRAVALSKFLRYPISYVYVKRDPASVVKSFQKRNIEQPSKSPIGAILYYFIVNIISKISVNYLRRRGFKVVEIKYEDLIREPSIVLSKISKEIDCNLDRPIKKIAKDEDLDVGNLFEGNRIRLQKKLKLKRNLPKSSNHYFLNKLNYFLYR